MFKKRFGKVYSVGSLLGRQMGSAAFKRGFYGQTLNILLKWDEIIPETYVPHARPHKLYDGVLTIATISASAGQNMQYQGPALIERINQFVGYGAVRELKFFNIGHRLERDGSGFGFFDKEEEKIYTPLVPTEAAKISAAKKVENVENKDMKDVLARIGALIETKNG